jgi:hypothetical protein
MVVGASGCGWRQVLFFGPCFEPPSTMPRRAPSEDEEMEDAEVKMQEDVVELNGHVEDAEEVEGGLPYDPDQKVEEKRKLRAQYRQLLGEQDGMYASYASTLILSLNFDSQNIAPIWRI